MRRKPDLAHAVSQLPAIAELRHAAIDKVTAAHLSVELLSRNYASDPVRELEVEERVIDFMEDAVYYFRRYLKTKMKKYEELLAREHTEQSKLIERGNTMIKEHRDDLTQLAKERGIQ